MSKPRASPRDHHGAEVANPRSPNSLPGNPWANVPKVRYRPVTAESPGAPTANPRQGAGPNRSGGEGLGGFERLSSE